MDLQEQFTRLEQQQKLKGEKRSKKPEKSGKMKTDISTAFGITDDLGLQVAKT